MTAPVTEPAQPGRRIDPEVELQGIERLERLLRLGTWLIRGGSVIALGMVSWGSYSVVRWIALPIPAAIAYPLVIDAAMLYVTPFAVNATLPDSKEWPIRRRATRVRIFVWIVVAAFNELHALLSLSHPAADGAVAPPTTGWYGVAAIAVATLYGIGPVIFYGYAYALEAQVAAWVLARQSEIRRTAAEQTTAKEENLEAAAVTAWLDAEQKWRRSQERARREPTREIQRETSRPALAAGSSSHLPLGENQQVTASPLAPSKRERAREYILQQVAAGRGHELEGPEIDRACEGKTTGRVVLREMRTAGECPPLGQPQQQPHPPWQPAEEHERELSVVS